MNNRIKMLLAAALSAALLSGCAQNTIEQSQTSQDSQISQGSQSSASAHSQSVSAASETTEPTEVTVQETGEETSAPTIEHDPVTVQPSKEDTSDAPAAQESSEQTTADTTPPAEQSTTSEVQTTTPATTTTTATTVITEPEPVNVVIPEVKVPLSPGINTASNDKVLVDFSNASEGYISVCWKETGKLVKLRITCGERVYDHDVATGGVTEYFPLSCGSGTYKVQIYEQTEGDRYAKSLEQEFSAEIAEVTPFLYPNKYVDFSQSSAVVEKAAVLCAGMNGTIEKIAAIFKWITDNVTYDKQLAATVKSGYVPDPDAVLKKRSGICYDYSSLLAAMLRSQGIPTRLVIGYAKDNIYHAWNEIWTEENGWITPELLLSKHGFNITDATFYAGSSDKEKIAGYISDSGNYSALYYY